MIDRYRDRRIGEPVVQPDRAVLLEQHRDPEDRQREEQERQQRDAVVEAAVLAQRREMPTVRPRMMATTVAVVTSVSVDVIAFAEQRR